MLTGGPTLGKVQQEHHPERQDLKKGTRQNQYDYHETAVEQVQNHPNNTYRRSQWKYSRSERTCAVTIGLQQENDGE